MTGDTANQIQSIIDRAMNTVLLCFLQTRQMQGASRQDCFGECGVYVGPFEGVTEMHSEICFDGGAFDFDFLEDVFMLDCF